MRAFWLSFTGTLIGVVLCFLGFTKEGGAAAVDSVRNFGLPLSGGTLTGGVLFSGGCTTDPSGSTVCFDNNGVSAAYPTTDVAPRGVQITGQFASPIATGGNQTGGSIWAVAGEGTTSGVVTWANCGAGDTVTLTFNDNIGATKTCTRDASLNDSTHFTCGADAAAAAVNIAACLSTATGISACSGAGCTTFTPVANSFYILPAPSEGQAHSYTLSTNDATMVAVTNGAEGNFMFCGGTGCAGFNIDASGVASFRSKANALFNISAGTFTINGVSSVSPAILGASAAAGTGYGYATVTSGGAYQWSSSTTNANTTLDTMLSRQSAGVICAGTATIGTCDGKIYLSGLTDATMTNQAAAGAAATKRFGRYQWTNAMVTALGASLTGDVKVATLPAKSIVTNAYIVVLTSCGGTASLTGALGRTAAAYNDYVVASNLQAAANTVYGDANAEHGTALTSGATDVPSYSATTDVYVHFISTGSNLSAVTTCTGEVYLEFILL